jgi:hypothetical protein
MRRGRVRQPLVLICRVQRYPIPDRILNAPPEGRVFNEQCIDACAVMRGEVAARIIADNTASQDHSLQVGRAIERSQRETTNDFETIVPRLVSDATHCRRHPRFSLRKLSAARSLNKILRQDRRIGMLHPGHEIARSVNSSKKRRRG